MRYDFIHIDVFFILSILMFLTNSILPLKYFFFFCYLITAKDKMWNGIGWYGFIGIITTSTTDISLRGQWYLCTGPWTIIVILSNFLLFKVLINDFRHSDSSVHPFRLMILNSLEQGTVKSFMNRV